MPLEVLQLSILIGSYRAVPELVILPKNGAVTECNIFEPPVFESPASCLTATIITVIVTKKKS